MSVEFFTDRGFPKQLRSLNGLRHYRRYGDGFDLTPGLNAVANIVQKASPWDLLTGLFVTKPQAEAAAQVAESQIQAQAIASQQASQQKTLRTIALVGAGVVGLVVVANVLKPKPLKPPKSVAGYRRKRKRR